MSSSSSTSSCHLVSGWFALGVQALLAFLCVTTLVIKRFQEQPRREWIVWFLDAAKQGASSSMGHMSNILASIIIASSIKDKNSDECQWYCLAYTTDCIFGTCFNFILLMVFERSIAFLSPSYAEYLKFGVYGDPPSVLRWFPQVLIWLVIVIISKCLVLSVLVAFIYPLDAAGKVLFSPFHDYPRIELVTVMIGIPMVLNSIQFWVTDTFLKLDINSSNDSGLNQMTRLPTESTHSDIDEELLYESSKGRSRLSIDLENNQHQNGRVHSNGNGNSLRWPSTSPLTQSLPRLYHSIKPLSTAREIAHGQITWYNTMFGHLRRNRKQDVTMSSSGLDNSDGDLDDSL